VSASLQINIPGPTESKMIRIPLIILLSWLIPFHSITPRSLDETDQPILRVAPGQRYVAWIVPANPDQWKLVILTAELRPIASTNLGFNRIESVTWQTDGRSLMVTDIHGGIREYSFESEVLALRNEIKLSHWIAADSVHIGKHWYLALVDRKTNRKSALGILDPSGKGPQKIIPDAAPEGFQVRPYLRIHRVSTDQERRYSVFIGSPGFFRVVPIDAPKQGYEISAGSGPLDIFEGYGIADNRIVVCLVFGECSEYEPGKPETQNRFRLPGVRSLKTIAIDDANIFWIEYRKKSLMGLLQRSGTRDFRACKLPGEPKALARVDNKIVLGYPSGTLTSVEIRKIADASINSDCSVLDRYVPE